MSRWTLLALVGALWTADGLLYALATTSPQRVAGGVLGGVLGFQLWIPYTLIALLLVRRFPIERGRRGRGLAVHGATLVVVLVSRALIVRALNPWIGWIAPVPPLPQHLLDSVRYNAMIYVLIVGAAHAMYFSMRAREREHEAALLGAHLATARLAALRSQLRPHFLANAITGIAELVHRDRDVADRMLMRLAELIRRTLHEDTGDEVTLESELGALAPYLELEQMRFGDRLAVVTDIEPSALGTRVPALVLQPLVENAIRHGIAPRAAPGTVTIRARAAASGTSLEVEDDGVGLPVKLEWGIGLANTRARLDALYGAGASFELERVQGGGTRVRIGVPREVS